MHEFIIINQRARDGFLTSSAPYLASDAFRNRISFKGAQGQKDALAIQLYLLKRVALDPRDLKTNQAVCEMGEGRLSFFGVATPGPWLELREEDQVMALRHAVQENLSSPLFAAAKRALKWRTGLAAERFRRHEDAVLNKLRVTLVWPGRAANEAERLNAEQLAAANKAALDTKCSTLRNRRQARRASLARAAAPGLKSWTDLLEDIALTVLTPV